MVKCLQEVRSLMRRTVLLLSAVAALVASAVVAAPGLSEQVVPKMLGVSVALDSSVDRVAESGAGFARTEVRWSDLEKEKGVYDFSALDSLFTKLESKDIRAIIVISGGNPLYESGRPPHTREGRTAFAAMAAAAAAKHKGAIWQVWNGPNQATSWAPKPNAQEYVELVQATSIAIKAADPSALVIGLSSWVNDLAFASRCFELGLLKSIDAVAVEGGGAGLPALGYGPLRELIAKHAGRGRTYPLVVNHQLAQSPAFVQTAGQLTDIADGVAVSIWPGAADSLGDLTGCKLVRKLGGRLEDSILLFKGNDGYRIAAWTTGSEREVTIPAEGDASKLNLTGTPAIVRSGSGERFALEEAVDISTGIDHRWRLQDEVNVAIVNPLSRTLKGEASITVPGMPKPMSRKFSVGGGKSELVHFDPIVLWDGRASVVAEVIVKFDGVATPIARTVDLGTSRRISARPSCPIEQIMEFQVSNPSGVRVKGRLRLTDIKGLEIKNPMVKFDADGSAIVALSLDEPARREFSFGYELLDSLGKVVFRAPVRNYTIIETFQGASNAIPPAAYDFVSFGDSNTKATSDAFCMLHDSQYTSLQRMSVLRLRYSCASGNRHFKLDPKTDLTLQGKPIELGMWLQGDGNGTKLTCRLTDASGKAIQPAGFVMDTKQWRYKTIQIDTAGSEAPYKLETLALIDPQGAAAIGSIYLGPIMVVSE